MRTVYRAAKGLLLGLGLAVLILVVGVMQPGGDGVVAAIRLSDGAEYMVTQRCHWSAEPYTIALYSRENEGSWGWCYIDHESNRWWKAALTFDAASDSVVLTESGKVKAVMDRRAKQWRLAGMGHRDLPQTPDVTPPYPFPL